MMTQKKTISVDLAVIGAGPGGYTAAFRAADLGMSVALIEKDRQLGGTCLLRGCIPSKMLLHVMSILQETNRLKQWGVHFQKPDLNIDRLRESKDKIIGQLAQGIDGLRKKRKVRLVHGTASFLSSQHLEIHDSSDAEGVHAKKVIIASGSKPVAFPSIPEECCDFFIDSTGALQLKDIPKRLLVIGGGVIALELGEVYCELGSEVVLVEIAERLLPSVDIDLVRPLKKTLEGIFSNIYVHTKIVDIVRRGDCVEVFFENSSKSYSEKFDKILCAIGRERSLDLLNLKNTSVQLDDRGFIVVDKMQRTQDSSIYAIGDVTEGPMLAHKAIGEAKIAAENVFGMNVQFDFRVIPNVIYTDPEIAWCGLTEKEAKKQNISFAVGKFPWSASGRNLVSGGKDGLSKVLVDPENKQILGAGIVGKHAGELISEMCLAIEMGSTVEDISLTMHPHPTLSESLSGATDSFLKIATDI